MKDFLEMERDCDEQINSKGSFLRSYINTNWCRNKARESKRVVRQEKT